MTRKMTTKDIANMYSMVSLEGDNCDEDEMIERVVLVINTGAFKHLTFEDNLEIDKRIADNILLTTDEVARNGGDTTQLKLNHKFKDKRLTSLYPNQVYYFLKDGLCFDRFMMYRSEEDAFIKLYKPKISYQGQLYYLQYIISRAKMYSYFIGEELAYLLAVKANERMIRSHTEDFTREYQNWVYERYLKDYYVPYTKTLNNSYYVSTRYIGMRDIFSEFEEGRIKDRGRLTVPIKRLTFKEKVIKFVRDLF